MWQWHGMPFNNNVSQIFMAIYDFLWHHKFLCLEFITAIFVMACHYFLVPWGFWNHEFTCMCMCTKQSIIDCNYDDNINSHFEKGDT
jgi:hypothetical protein